MVERPRPVIRMTVGMRRKTAVVASARVGDDSDGVRCTGNLRCDLHGNSRCRLPQLPRWIRVNFLLGLEPASDRVRTQSRLGALGKHLRLQLRAVPSPQYRPLLCHRCPPNYLMDTIVSVSPPLFKVPPRDAYKLHASMMPARSGGGSRPRRRRATRFLAERVCGLSSMERQRSDD